MFSLSDLFVFFSLCFYVLGDRHSSKAPETEHVERETSKKSADVQSTEAPHDTKNSLEAQTSQALQRCKECTALYRERLGLDMLKKKNGVTERVLRRLGIPKDSQPSSSVPLKPSKDELEMSKYNELKRRVFQRILEKNNKAKEASMALKPSRDEQKTSKYNELKRRVFQRILEKNHKATEASFQKKKKSNMTQAESTACLKARILARLARKLS